MKASSLYDVSNETMYYYTSRMLEKGIFIDVADVEGDNENGDYETWFTVYYRHNGNYGWHILCNDKIMLPIEIVMLVEKLVEWFNEYTNDEMQGLDKFIEFLNFISISHISSDMQASLSHKADIIDDYTKARDFIKSMIE